MSKKIKSVESEENSKWAQRGFMSKNHYIGWLQFNDLVDESFGYDDTYYDPYSGKTINLCDPASDKDVKDDADKFLDSVSKQ